MKIENKSKEKSKSKRIIILVILLFVAFHFLYINKQEDNKIVAAQQENYKEEKENKKLEDEVRKELAELMTKEPRSKKDPPKIIFEGFEFNYVDEEAKEDLKAQLVYILNAVCQNKELKEFYKRVDITFMITSNIARLAKEKKLPIRKIEEESGSDAFYFVGKIPGEKVEQIIILDAAVFYTDMKLLVVLMHESIHARNFVIGTAKKDFFDEEIQVCEQTINSLEDFYKDINLEKQSPKMAEELKLLILEEKLVLATFRHKKNLKAL